MADNEWGHHEEINEEPEVSHTTTTTQSPQELRQLANAHFQNQDYDSALPLYTLALEGLVRDQSHQDSLTLQMNWQEFKNLHVIFLCNRAACLFRMELWEEAKMDALQALQVSEGTSAKASFRLAKAHLELGEYAHAVQVTEDALEQLKTTQGVEKEEKKDTGAQEIQRKEFRKLLEKARVLHLKQQKVPNAQTLATVHSIKEEPRKPSIREFEILQELGEGNFSRVVAVRHSSK